MVSKSVWMIVVTTLFTSTAQLLFKEGSSRLPEIVFNWPLLLGICIYAASAAVLVFALKGDDVSTLYPITASSYIWVTLFAVYLFNESLSLFKVVGLLFVFTGVVLLGASAKKKEIIPVLTVVK